MNEFTFKAYWQDDVGKTNTEPITYDFEGYFSTQGFELFLADDFIQMEIDGKLCELRRLAQFEDLSFSQHEIYIPWRYL